MNLVNPSNHVIRKPLQLSMNECGVLHFILTHSQNDEYWECIMTREQMADILDLSVKTVFNILVALEAKGYITKNKKGLLPTKVIRKLDKFMSNKDAKIYLESDEFMFAAGSPVLADVQNGMKLLSDDGDAIGKNYRYNRKKLPIESVKITDKSINKSINENIKKNSDPALAEPAGQPDTSLSPPVTHGEVRIPQKEDVRPPRNPSEEQTPSPFQHIKLSHINWLTDNSLPSNIWEGAGGKEGSALAALVKKIAAYIEQKKPGFAPEPEHYWLIIKQILDCYPLMDDFSQNACLTFSMMNSRFTELIKVSGDIRAGRSQAASKKAQQTALPVVLAALGRNPAIFPAQDFDNALTGLWRAFAAKENKMVYQRPFLNACLALLDGGDPAPFDTLLTRAKAYLADCNAAKKIPAGLLKFLEDGIYTTQNAPKTSKTKVIRDE